MPLNGFRVFWPSFFSVFLKSRSPSSLSGNKIHVIDQVCLSWLNSFITVLLPALPSQSPIRILLAGVIRTNRMRPEFGLEAKKNYSLIKKPKDVSSGSRVHGLSDRWGCFIGILPAGIGRGWGSVHGSGPQCLGQHLCVGCRHLE